MIKAGVDIGSRTIKVVLHDGQRKIHSEVRENTFNTLEVCKSMLEGLNYDSITATGYGRHLFADRYNATTISEIKAFAIGINNCYPNVRTILDIGGQDTKAITIDEKGNVKRFEMNDKCAAGTGRFLEIMAMALRYEIDEFGEKATHAKEAAKVNSMCTVFAESEVISQIANGANRENIARGIHESIVKRSIMLLNRVGIDGDIAFVGGVAKNSAMLSLLEKNLKRKIYVPDNPQIIGALGCAIV
ncbi:MAG: 3-hydroxyacyl-ACP dehydratase [Bacteroidales bacterium]|nr:MAG: 3-hydroxyacyl-ACP dehydratase [Bacteroidales bacterium]